MSRKEITTKDDLIKVIELRKTTLKDVEHTLANFLILTY